MIDGLATCLGLARHGGASAGVLHSAGDPVSDRNEFRESEGKVRGALCHEGL